MEALSRMKPVIAAALICAVLVTFSVVYVDRPVERWVADNTFSHKGWLLFFDLMATPSLLPMPAACLYMPFHALRRLAGRTSGPLNQLFLALSVATSVATLAKDELKWLIGRPWPSTWARYGDYKLHPFISSFFYGSFPSGHTTYIAAPMFVLWWRLPRYRALWLAIILSVMIGLVLSGHHWVGDVIAGFFLGLAAAAGTVAAEPKMPVLVRAFNSRSRRSP